MWLSVVLSYLVWTSLLVGCHLAMLTLPETFTDENTAPGKFRQVLHRYQPYKDSFKIRETLIVLFDRIIFEKVRHSTSP